MTIDSFFSKRPRGRSLFRTVDRAVRGGGPCARRVTKSQIAYSRKRAFAWVWTPDRWLKGKTAPLVVSVSLFRRDRSKKWKEVVEPRKGRWIHHREIFSSGDVDPHLKKCLQEAWEGAALNLMPKQ